METEGGGGRWEENDGEGKKVTKIEEERIRLKGTRGDKSQVLLY